MRRINFWWTYLVGCIVCIAYGGGTLIYHFSKGNGLSVHALILLIIGGVCLVIFLVLYIVSLIQKKTQASEQQEPAPEIVEDVNNEEPVEEEPQEVSSQSDDVDYAHIEHINPTNISHRPSSSNGGRTIYVKKVGYGPVLRFEGDRILSLQDRIGTDGQWNRMDECTR